MWSTAVYDLRLTAEAFYGMTWGMFFALLERRRIEMERELLMQGRLMATVANFSFYRPKKALTAKDFMPGTEKPPRRRMSAKRRQQVADSLRSMMAPYVRT